MSEPRPRGPVVIDTGVFGADLVPGSLLAERYAPLIVGRAAFISFQTATEVRYGAYHRGWGAERWRTVEASIASAIVVHSGEQLVQVCARLQADCRRQGHALAQREHTADRWIAATALRLGLPLVSDDGIFQDVPGLILETIDPS